VAAAWLALGEYHLRAGELTRARAALEQAERTSGPAQRPLAAVRLADASLMAGDLDGGLAAADRALAAGSRADLLPLLERFAATRAHASWSVDAQRRLADLLERAGDGRRAAEVRAHLVRDQLARAEASRARAPARSGARGVRGEAAR
jgi:hypothetical protein